jgi:hypothetical protein
MFNRGVLLAGTLINAKVIRVEPPLTITNEEIEEYVSSVCSTIEYHQFTNSLSLSLSLSVSLSLYLLLLLLLLLQSVASYG